jgi:hypothetical protein
MKKKALVLLLVPATSILLAGCNPIDSLRSLRAKVIDTMLGIRHKMDDFFTEPAPEEGKTESGVAYTLSYHE